MTVSRYKLLKRNSFCSSLQKVLSIYMYLAFQFKCCSHRQVINHPEREYGQKKKTINILLLKIWQKKDCLKLVEPFSGHYLAKKCHNCPKLWDKSDTAPSSFSFIFLSIPFFPYLFSLLLGNYKASFGWEKFQDSRLDLILKT